MAKFAEGLKNIGPCITRPGYAEIRILKVKPNWKLKEPLTTSDASWLLLPEVLPQGRNGMHWGWRQGWQVCRSKRPIMMSNCLALAESLLYYQVLLWPNGRDKPSLSSWGYLWIMATIKLVIRIGQGNVRRSWWAVDLCVSLFMYLTFCCNSAY